MFFKSESNTSSQVRGEPPSPTFRLPYTPRPNELTADAPSEQLREEHT